MSTQAVSFGPFTLYSIQTGYFKLDGGAMFGVVPKTLWSRYIPADDRNLIPMCMRCLLITSSATGRVYLIDNGAGSKFDAKFRDIYQIDDASENVHSSLAKAGFSVNDITDVIFTHLHFDHCGGTTAFNAQGELEHVFPNANYWVTKAHMETALHPNFREKASFLKENIAPISSWSKLNLIDDHFEYEPGLDMITVNGHTKGMQLPRISHGAQTMIFAADLIPTYAHVSLAWVMGYDMCASETLIEKKQVLEMAIAHDWWMFLEHDAQHDVIKIRDHGKGPVAETGYSLKNLQD